MKKFFLHTLIIYAIFSGGLFAQDFPKTYMSTSCVNCTPAGYSVVSGGPVSLSNMTGVGGSPIKNWVNVNGLPGTSFSNPPSSNKIADKNEGNVFLTLKNNGVQQDKVKAYVTGFEIGMKYTIHYYVMTARAHLTAATISDYATGAKLDVSAGNGQGGLSLITSKTTNFTPGVNVDEWVEQTLTFVAPKVDLHFELSGLGGQQWTSYVNFDIYSKPFDCIVPGGQVELSRSTVNTLFACESINLYDLIKTQAPPGTQPVWSTVSTHGFTQMTPEEASHAKSSTAGEDYFAFFKSPNGCFNADVSTGKAVLTAKPTQVSLTSNQRSINCINQTGVDLTAQLTPTNYAVHWFTSDIPGAGQLITNPQNVPVGNYYAFYYHGTQDGDCYSVSKAAASANFSVIGSTMCCNDPTDPANQIPLLQTDVKIIAPATTYDLTKLIPANISIPPFTVIEWYTTPDHSDTPLATPEKADPGKYYVFAHDLKNGCFNVPLSKSSVNVSKACNAGNTPVALKTPLAFYCEVGEPAMNLNDFVVGAPPAGLSVVWYTNDQHTGSSIPMPAPMDYLPHYYAFFYDNVNQCFSPPSQTLNLQSKQVPVSCPYEGGCQYSTCPSGSVNLNALHVGTVPNGWELRWFNNRKHTGQQVATPGNVTASGDYFAFYYNTNKQCYNKSGVQQDGGEDLGNKKITVVSQACANGPQLQMQVALQGAYVANGGDLIMHNQLQEYVTPTGKGLLPAQTPYGGLETKADINTGESVVDWIKVEIRDAANPSILLDSKSLLLGLEGIVRDVDGAYPVFNAQSVPVRIVVKHRNHLAVMSNPIQDFSSGIVSYAFTTALSQASNEFGDPAQMVQKNGIWCMNAGDLNANQDFLVDGVDGSFLNVQFKSDVFGTYDRADINMDGFVDGVDGSLFNTSFYQDIYSTLINY